MSQDTMERLLLRDCALTLLVVIAIIVVPFVAAAWIVGLLCLVLIPLFAVGLVVWAICSAAALGDEQMQRALESRRRDESSSDGPIQPVFPEPTPLVSALPNWRAPGLPLGSARPTPRQGS